MWHGKLNHSVANIDGVGTFGAPQIRAYHQHVETKIRLWCVGPISAPTRNIQVA
jgi:hypothetical protein